MEVEAKFIIPDELTFQHLLEATSLAGFDLAEGTVAELHDQYLDTAGRALQAGGYACRIRRQASQTLVTLKGLGTVTGAVHRRIEHQVDLPESLPPQDWPSSVARDLTLRLSGGDPLLPLFEIEQTRHQRTLHQGEHAVAELNLDRARLCRGGVVAPAFLELEVELLPGGSEADLDRIAVELQERWELVPQTQSKFARGLARFDTRPVSLSETRPDRDEYLPLEQDQKLRIATVELLSQPGIEPDDPMSEAGRKTFRFHFRRMLYNEAGTRLGEDIEALHDMRVATRRMRAAFRVFGEYYEPKEVAPYLKGLRRTGRALGPVRDLDVFRAKVRAYLSALPEPHQGRLDGFLAVLEAQREAARGRMVTYLDSAKYALFREHFGQFVETEGVASRPFTLNGSEPIPYRVRHVAPTAIYQRLAAVRAYDEWVNIPWTDLPDPPLKRLHSLRIAGKRLRYALEFFSEALGPSGEAIVKEVVTMQDHLGDLQDAVVARRILREYLQRGAWGPSVAAEAGMESPSGAPQDAASVEAYLAAKEAELEHLLDKFPQVWQRITGTEFSQGVADAVVVL